MKKAVTFDKYTFRALKANSLISRKQDKQSLTTNLPINNLPVTQYENARMVESKHCNVM